MIRTGSKISVEFIGFPPGSRLSRLVLGTATVLSLSCGFAAPGRADPTMQDTLPSVSITTTAPMDLPVAATTSDAAAITAATVQPKPLAHRVHRIQLQTIDTASLTTPITAGLVGHARVIEASATALRPAPLPDQDVDAPGPDAQALASQQETSVAPSFYGNKDHFSGDGFAAGSNLESDKNNRRKPGGGMSLSIPVQ